MKNWYIVQSHSSFENKVAQLIKEEAEKAKVADKIEEIVVPTHDVTEVKIGKRVQRKKKYFPGYVLIKSEMDNNLYHMIKGIKKVYNSKANFILVKVQDPIGLFEFLVKNKILVRDRSNLVRDSLRLTVGTIPQNKLLLKIIEKYYE